jgi:hypothetical protein
MKPKALVQQYQRKLTKVQKTNAELFLRVKELEDEVKTLQNFAVQQQTHIQELVEKYEPH